MQPFRETGLVERYFTAVAAEGIYPNRGNLEFRLAYLLDSVRVEGTRVLEIGCGAGWLGLFARCLGAREVVFLEPEAAGSSRGSRQVLLRLIDRIGVGQVRVVPTTIQQFDGASGPFDLILMHNSINHLDEEACSRLLTDRSALLRYRAILGKIGALAGCGAALVASDCSPHNLFPMLGFENPFLPRIEWTKHQSPRTWAGLLEGAGFEGARIRWSSFNSLRRTGRLLLGNTVASFFLTSHFCLTMTRTGDAPTQVLD